MAWTTPTIRATGDLITASIWNTDIVNDLKSLWHIADETTFTDKSVPSSTTIVTGASVAFDGVQQARIEFWSPHLDLAASASAQLTLTLSEDSTSIGVL